MPESHPWNVSPRLYKQPGLGEWLKWWKKWQDEQDQAAAYQSLQNDETATFTKHKLYNFHIFYQSNRIYTWSIFEIPTGIFDL